MEQHKPFQVMLTEEQHRQLRALSERRGRSMGSLVRESVTAYLTDLPDEDDPLAGIIGAFADHGPKPYGDVGEEHDRYLADIVWQERAREGPGTERS